MIAVIRLPSVFGQEQRLEYGHMKEDCKRNMCPFNESVLRWWYLDDNLTLPIEKRVVQNQGGGWRPNSELGQVLGSAAGQTAKVGRDGGRSRVWETLQQLGLINTRYYRAPCANHSTSGFVPVNRKTLGIKVAKRARKSLFLQGRTLVLIEILS